MATGMIARALAQKESEDKTVWDDAFMSGLLHDVGKLILVSCFPEDYREVLQIVEKEKSPIARSGEKHLRNDAFRGRGISNGTLGDE